MEAGGGGTEQLGNIETKSNFNARARAYYFQGNRPFFIFKYMCFQLGIFQHKKTELTAIKIL